MTKFLNISTDNTLGGNAPSDELVVSQKAIKEYVDSQAGGVESVNTKTGVVVLTGEDIAADVSELTDTIQGHLQTLHDNIKDIELFKFPNATIIGSPTIDHGQVSGFTANDYLQFPFIVDLHNQPFVIDFCFTTGNNVTTQQNILDSQFGLALAIANGKGLMAISHNGTSWAGAVTGTLAIQPNTTYYARLSWNRINYKTELSTDGKTYVSDMNFGSTQSPYPRTMFIGGCSGSVIGHTAHPFGGTINMNYAYLTVAGNVIWQGMDDAGLATRLASDVSNITEEGEERIKQITGVDAKQNKLIAGENITIDEATNTISATGGGSSYHPDLFDHKWADHILNDVQWLRADTFSWQSGAVYQAAYAHLVLDVDGKTLQSETVAGTTVQFYLADDGHKICPASEESNIASIYSATGVAWYYIIDTVNQKFKLPRSSHNKYTTELGVIGTGKTLGLTDGTNNYGLCNGSTYARVTVGTGYYNRSVSASGGENAGTGANRTLGVTTDSAKSGVKTTTIAQDTDQYKYLYFYVGNFTQTALENTAGVVTEDFNELNAHKVIAFQAPTADNNYTWYRKYADGWVEQGGAVTLNGTISGSNKTVNLPIQMSGNLYYSNVSQDANAGGTVRVVIGWQSTTSFTVGFAASGGVNGRVWWHVSGMAAN